MTAVAVALPTADFGFLVSSGGVIRVLAAAAFTGAAGVLLGAGLAAGALVPAALGLAAGDRRDIA